MQIGFTSGLLNQCLTLHISVDENLKNVNPAASWGDFHLFDYKSEYHALDAGPLPRRRPPSMNWLALAELRRVFLPN